MAQDRARLIRSSDPRDVDSIELGADAYVDRLYGCFRFDNPLADGFQTERQVRMVFLPPKDVRVSVPESMRIALPEGGKLVNTELFHLEPIGSDSDTMHLLTMRVGWNQNERDINRIIELDPAGVFCARLVDDGYDIPVGTCVVSPLGAKATWIGMILVHPELRRQGLATAMMRRCIEYAIDSGKVVNGLDATPMGSTVYVNVGYEGTFRIWRSVFQTSEFAGAKCKRAKLIEPADLEAVIAYDQSCFMDRGNVLRALYADAEGDAWYYSGDDGRIAGYVFGRSGRIRAFVGPMMADSEEAAADLLAAVVPSFVKKGYAEAFIDTPEIRFADPGRYDKSVFDQAQKPSSHRLIRSAKPVRDFTRMYQAVDDRKAEQLTADFAASNRLSSDDERVAAFGRTMRRSVANYTVTRGFMELEQRELQHKLWATTGPEKG